jgi:hypothetical protein
MRAVNIDFLSVLHGVLVFYTGLYSQRHVRVSSGVSAANGVPDFADEAVAG